MNFLRIYIYSGGSVKRTAEALFMHKNTVYQKIEKLKEFSTWMSTICMPMLNYTSPWSSSNRCPYMIQTTS